MIRTNALPKDHFEGRWKKGKKYTLYAVVVNNGTKFRSVTPKEKDEPYVIYDSTNETFSANSGWEIVEMSEDSRLSAMSGNGGGSGEPGEPGKDAGFGTITASVSNTGGTPSVEVSTSGPDTAKNISFAFHNLKGAQGAPGVSNADIKVVDTLPEASSQTTGRIYLVETETAGTYARWYTEVDGTTYTWRQIGTTAVALADYATKAEVSQLEAKVDEELADGIEVRTFDHSTFTSPNDNIMVGESDIKFANVGDYLEIKVNPNGTNGYWLYRATSYNQPGMRFSSSNSLQIRFSSTVNFTYQDAVHFNWNNIVVIKVVLTAINDSTYTYDIYADGVKVGTQDAGVLRFTQIGHNTIMDLYYIKLRIGGVERTLTKFGEMTGAVGVTDVYSSEQFDGLVRLNERASDLEEDMDIVKTAVVGEDMYVSFVKNSTVWNMESHFAVYQRLKGNYYLQTIVGLYTTTSDNYPKGYWRIERTNLVTIIGGVITIVEGQILTSGENEFVLKWLAGSGYNASGGFTGGFHFGEKIDGVTGAWVEFIIDGNRIGTTEDFSLKPCKSFLYREHSAIYNCHDNPATIAAWHLKETKFKDGGYETINDVKFVQALDYFAYPGIVCVSRWLSEKAMPENVATITDMGDGSSPRYQFQSHANRIHYEGNGYLCDVESEVLIGADDSQCDLSVYNGADYNKYYRKNPDTAGSVDNRLKARTKVKISAM